MGFWIYMLLTALLIPLIMIGVGCAFTKTAPKNITHIFGYRTAMSMKNRDTWEFAHKHCGKLWVRLGLILLPLSILPMLFVIGKSEDTIGTTGAIVCLLGAALLILSIFPTERALRKTFDENGNRKE